MNAEFFGLAFLILLSAGALVATGRLHGRHREPVPAWAGSGGWSYLTALHHLVAGKYATATQVS